MKLHWIAACCVYIGLLAACSKNSKLTPTMVDEPIVNVPVTIMQDNLDLIDNGVVYFACDYGPYYFNIDSLQNVCSSEYILSDSLLTEINSFSCTYDYSANNLYEGSNFDFKVERFENSFLLDSLNSNADIDSVNYVFNNDTFAIHQYPYYIGYNIQYSNSNLQLYFFNEFIGGCFHDKMFWFFYQ